jgi:hypothetical protein
MTLVWVVLEPTPELAAAVLGLWGVMDLLLEYLVALVEAALLPLLLEQPSREREEVAALAMGLIAPVERAEAVEGLSVAPQG